jgi:hypothetical protein
MFLEILLIVLILCMVGVTTLAYLWWKKYGKKIFGLIESAKSMNKIFTPNNTTKFSNTETPSIDVLTDRLNLIKDLMGNIKNTKNGNHFKK